MCVWLCFCVCTVVVWYCYFFSFFFIGYVCMCFYFLYLFSHYLEINTMTLPIKNINEIIPLFSQLHQPLNPILSHTVITNISLINNIKANNPFFKFYVFFILKKRKKNLITVKPILKFTCTNRQSNLSDSKT